jgi:hypothetical protein
MQEKSSPRSWWQAVEIPMKALASGQLIIEWQSDGFNFEIDKK